VEEILSLAGRCDRSLRLLLHGDREAEDALRSLLNRALHPQFLIRDRAAKYSGPFDEVFCSEGVRVIRAPIRSPKANAFAERFVGTMRRECLEHVLVLGERHLEKILREYVRHYTEEGAHRGLVSGDAGAKASPEPRRG
jgi:putative transposase